MSQKITKTIVITGTHLTPALELIRQLKNDKKFNWNISYIGRKFNSSDSKEKSIESVIIPKLNVNYFSIDCGKFDRKYFPNTLKGLVKTLKGFFESQKIITKIKPDIIISFGGYVSVPVIINGWFKHISSITHEQTSTNSLTTKINSLFVTKVALSFNNPKQLEHLPKNKVVISGNLLRNELFTQTIKIPSISKTSKPIIFITAGNQGSHSINLTIKKILPHLNEFTVIHQTGQIDFDKFKKTSTKYKNYYPFAYIETKYMGWIFQNTLLVISRSGANTSQEIAAFSKNSILIPLPKSQQNEQLLNANWVKQLLPQQTIIIHQQKLNTNTLLKAIQSQSLIKTGQQTIKPIINFKLLQLIHEII